MVEQETSTEAEREKMTTQAQELAEREGLSARELREFVGLIWDLGREGHDIDEMMLPNQEQPSLIICVYSDEEADITLLSGLDEQSGEIIALERGKKGLQWQIGVWGSYPSTFLGREILVNNPDAEPILSKEPLTPEECSKLAKTIWEVHNAASTESPK